MVAGSIPAGGLLFELLFELLYFLNYFLDYFLNYFLAYFLACTWRMSVSAAIEVKHSSGLHSSPHETILGRTNPSLSLDLIKIDPG